LKLFTLLGAVAFSVIYWTSVSSQLIDPIKIESQQEEIKQKAFKVLVNKCNSCHATKRNRKIFTLENMGSLSEDINTQVFVKEKMPKGKKNELTTDEKELLKRWLSTL